MTNNISLLEQITSQEVEDLIFEESLLKKGYNFHYFIDQGDIEKYCFPFGVVEGEKFDEREKRSVEIITDEQIAYDFIFNFQKENPIMFNEHIEELEKFKDKIKRITLYGIKIIDSFKIQIDYFEKVKEGKSVTFEQWINNQKLTSELNVSLLISIALGSLRTGIENINKLESEKLIYKTSDLEKVNLSIYEPIFDNCIPGLVTEKLYDNLIDSYSNRSAPNQLISRYNKCKVFDRLLCINKKAKSNSDIFLLLSSAKSINERLPKIANDLGIGLKYENLAFNPIRTIQQIYLQLLLKGDENKIEELNKFRKILILKENEKSVEVKEMLNELISNYFEIKLSSLREGYENVSLLLKIDSYKKLFEQALKTDNLVSKKKISTSILELLKIAESTNELEKFKSTSLINSDYVRSYNKILLNALDEINFGTNVLNAFSGLDYVENSYHTIPFVFFKGSPNFKKVINDIVILATESLKDNFNSRKLIESVNNSFDLLYHKTLPTEEERVIMLLILMMVGNNNYNPDEFAYEWINEILDNNEFNEDWKNDFLYIKSWICRRIEKYDESIQIAKLNLEPELGDPRFFHSLYLGYYCKYKKFNDKEFLLEAKKYCEISLKKYHDLFLDNSELVINKTYISQLNSSAYLHTLLYKLDNSKIENIEIARANIDKLKKIDKFYYKFSEFLHTEALLEIQEFKIQNKVDKLNYALISIDNALKIKQKDEYKAVKDEINLLLTSYLQ